MRHFIYLLILCLGFGFMGCGGEEANDATGDAVAASESTAETDAESEGKFLAKSASAVVGEYLVKDQKEQRIARLKLSSDETEVEFQGGTIVGNLTHSGKRLYYAGSNRIMKVILKEDGFEVNSGGDKLLWKVKVKEETIEISDNATASNPFVLAIEGDKLAVNQGGELKANFPIDREKHTMNAPGYLVYTIEPYENLRAFSVYGIREVLPPYSHVIAAELLAWGI